MEKYIADMHVHSKYSFDSNMPIKKIIEGERQKGIKVVAITDHVELSKDNMLTVVRNLCSRENEINNLQEKNDIFIIRGIEISEPHLYQKAVDYLRSLNFIDYIVGSIHHMNGKSLANYKNDISEYLKIILEMVKTANIDTLAHLDYIKRYGITGNFDEHLIDEILKTIIERNIALEINSSGYRRCGSAFPSMDIIERYVELGGSKVVYGSDAHKENELYDGIDKAVNKTKRLNLNKGIIINGHFKSI